MTDKAALLARITDDPRLPTPPNVALQVLERANRPQCTILEISQVISHDPSLCSKILKMVNSSLFALPRAVTSIERALQLLGLKRVRSLVLSLSLPAMQLRSKSNPRMRDYWKASVATAIVARELATRLRSPDPDSEMVAGLLSDLGVLILQEVYPDQYLQVLAYPPEILVNSQCEVEEKLFGVHHAEVSAYLLKRWRLPDEVTQPIQFHHHRRLAPTAHAERTHLLFFASRVAQLQLTVGQSVILGDIVSTALERYGMNDEQLREFLEPLAKKIEDFASLLQVDIGACHQYPTLFANVTENLSRLAVETSLDNFRVEEAKVKAETELKKTTEALEKTEEKLRQAMKLEAIGRLAGGVAHDFNNLLTIINGYTELVLGNLATDSTDRAFLKEVKDAGEKAANLTQQLLAFSRKQILVPQVLSLNEVLTAMERMLRRLIREDVDLIFKLDPELRLVKVDPSQLDQVIMNLAVNARDAMPQGGRLTIETKNIQLNEQYLSGCVDLEPGPYVRMTITDTGIGMNSEIQSRLFEPFFTTKEGKGTGLGLATVHGIVKQSGGHISVSSEVQRGTSFRVYLPIVAEKPTPRKNENADIEHARGTETILLTEDDDNVRKIGRRILEAQGYRVIEACDGWVALEAAQAHRDIIHLLVTDTIMPNMGGCELAQRLAQARPAIKVLYTSGYADDAVIRQGVMTSSTPFLQKPFTPHALTTKVRDILGSNRDKL